MRAAPVLIIDLDGTLLSVNSFRLWSIFILRGRFPHLAPSTRAGIACTALKLLMLRKARRLSHNQLKWRLQHLWQAATVADSGATEARFVRELQTYVRPEFVPIVKAIQSNEADGILATAAAGDYAYAFGRSLGFRHILATARERNGQDPDNAREQKVAAVMNYLGRLGWEQRPRVLFTDHRDDLPLVRACQTVFWFGSARERDAIVQSVRDVRIETGFGLNFTDHASAGCAGDFVYD